MLRSPSLAALLGTTALFAAAGLPAGAQNLPTGGSVVSGGVAISGGGNQLTIQQSTGNAIVNWQGFSISAGARVDIQQPGANAAILNRVTGSTPSSIAGQLNANGQVYLVNPNGIAITPTGTVNAAGFVASSLGITDEDFRNGRRNFSGNGASAAVSNAGTISIGRGGYAALIGGEVSNSGTISVPIGRVALGSGEQATLDLSGDGFLQVAVPTQAGGRRALVRNSGTISANGGRVELSAATARDAARRAINMSGIIEATEVSGRSGAIVFSGGEGGSVRVSGRVDATSATTTGGDVTVTGRAIALRGATIDASGATGGGRVRIGGERQGGGTLQRAERVRVDNRTTIRADATRRGNGGEVTIWSDNRTNFSGTIAARGGPEAGNGGQAEVSSKGLLGYTGLTILTAARGNWGTLLLDPYNIIISNDPDSNQSGFIATGNDSIINAGTLLTALGSANVVVSTGVGGAQAGNITITAPLAWNTNASLTLDAAGAIAINAAITAGAGGLILSSGGQITATEAVSVARFTLVAGDWVQNTATLPGFATADFRIQGGSFLRAIEGDGTPGAPYVLADIYGVQGITSLPGTNSYALTNDIDASGTRNWNGGLGWAPIQNFAGNLDGRMHVIDGLTINRPGEGFIGLFGMNLGNISNLGLTNVAITGLSNVGAFAGRHWGGSLDNVYATGTVTGSVEQVGGLAGWADNSTISRSYADVAVTGGTEAGGLVGRATAVDISNSYALGSVTGSTYVGGLVGSVGDFAVFSLNNVYASGRVTGAGNVGGLVGGISPAATSVTINGGLWDSETTGQAISAGGGTPRTTAQMRDTGSYSTFDFATVWFQAGDMRPILRSEAGTPDGTFTYTITNLHQLALMGADLNTNYRLGRDIDASATAGTNPSGIFGAGGFVPVGSQSTPSASDFDGAGFSIRNLVINRPGENYVGMIGTLDTGGSVSNVNLVGGSVTGATAAGAVVGVNNGLVSNVNSSAAVSSTAGGAGGIAGFNFGTIDRSSSSGAISGVGVGIGYVGGLVGQNVGSITNSYATGVITSTGNFTGGLVGLNTGSISQSYATGDVTSTAGDVGGLVGDSAGGTIYQVYATGAVTGADYVGGLIGLLQGGSVDQAWASGRVTATAPSDPANPVTGGAFGFAFNSPVVSAVYFDIQTTGQSVGSSFGSDAGTTGLSTALARQQAGYAGFDFTMSWYQAGDMRPILRAEAAPVGTDNVIPIRNFHQLQLMDADVYASYRLTDDIDASATAGTNPAGVFGPGGFVPVGQSIPFFGTLDGGGHRITDLNINRPTEDYVGLFGFLCNCVTVSNVGLVGGSIVGRQYVGALAGVSEAFISGSYATTSVSGSGDVGGLVGWNSGGIISQSYATGDVTASNGSAGGLVGRMDNLGTVVQSYATGNVEATEGAGGLIGRADNAAVTQSYTTGNVTGTAPLAFAGGLIGFSNASLVFQSYATGATNGPTTGGLIGASEGSLFDQTYAVGAVNGTANAGGLIGLDLDGNNLMTSSYWNITTTGQSASAVGGVGLTTAQMQDLYSYRTTFAGFDFDTVWTPPNQAGQGGSVAAHYPELIAFSNAVVVGVPNATRLYGDANPSFGSPIVTVTGLRNGDFLTGVGNATTPATASSDVGSYGILLDGIATTNNSGAAYRVLQTGQLDITARPITVTADAPSRSYGDANPALTFTTSPLGAGAAVAGALATTATATSDVGAYAITQGGVTNAANPNYLITYVGADLTVTARAITVTADAQSRSYGDANPALTYTTTSLGAGVAVTGTLSTGATATSDVGAYAITQGGVTNTANPNYAITYVGANLSVTPRPVTVTADARSRSYGDANPSLTYTTTSLGAGAALTGSLSTAATPTSNVGAYAIAQGGVTNSANPNYAITYVGANLSVTPRPITVTADAQTRIYGDANPSLTYTTTSLGAGAALTGSLSTAATSASNVGTYAIGQGGVTNSANPNYAITYAGANLLVTPRPIIVTADAQNRLQGQANPVLTYVVGGRGLVNGDGLAGGLATAADASSAPGPYAITQGSLTGGLNYALTYIGANLTVLPAPAPPTPAPPEPVLTFDTSLTGSLIDTLRAAIQPLPWSQLPITPTTQEIGNDGTIQLIVDPRFNGAQLCFGARGTGCLGP